MEDYSGLYRQEMFVKHMCPPGGGQSVGWIFSTNKFSVRSLPACCLKIKKDHLHFMVMLPAKFDDNSTKFSLGVV